MGPRPLAAAAASPPLSPGEGRGEGAPRGFSLVELLVVISIVLVMMGLMGAALSSARGNQKKQGTQALIAKLDAVIATQFASYAGRDVSLPENRHGLTPETFRSWYIRRNMINADLPDRWADVEYIASRSNEFSSPTQQVYRAVWNSMNPKPSTTHEGAECLFMIVMRGGIANCLDCSDLANSNIDDKDKDGAFEFHDAWGNPIEFLLWPSAVELPAGDGVKFFSGARALQAAFPTAGPAPPPALGMRPLIYSPGPDGKPGLVTRPSESNLGAWKNKTLPPQVAGRDCGNWQEEPASLYGRWDESEPDARYDNITNFDAEAKQ